MTARRLPDRRRGGSGPVCRQRRIDELSREAERGTPVFFESLFADEREAKVLAGLQARFNLVQRAPYFFQLLPR